MVADDMPLPEVVAGRAPPHVTLQISEEIGEPPSRWHGWHLMGRAPHTAPPMPTQPLLRPSLTREFNSMISDITPFVDRVNSVPAPSLSWLHRPPSISSASPPAPAPGPAAEHPRSQIHINLGGPGACGTREGREGAPPPPEPAAPPDNHQQPNEEDDAQINTRAELVSLLRSVLKYAPFALILLSKFAYDHREGLLTFLMLLITFHHANGVVRDELACHASRSLRRLLFEFSYTVVCICLIDYVFHTGQHFSRMILMVPSYTQPLTAWDLLWVVCVTDFILKLITIDCKILLTCLPNRVFPFTKRGKVFYLLESTSQLYRSLVPVQPWLYYLLEAYQGSEKLLGVLLSTIYMISKSVDVIDKGSMFKKAALQLWDNSELGVSPTFEQLSAAGPTCPICHEEFSSPVRLSCQHIFCSSCVSRWLDRTKTCPLCRATIIPDSDWRDGSTSQYLQLY